MALFDDILFELEEMVEEAFNVPLTGGKCLIKADELKERLEALRLNLPIEMKKATQIVNERDKILEKAKIEYDSKIAAAETKAQYLLNNERITKEATINANQIIKTAEEEAGKIRKAASSFVDGNLKKTEELLTASLSSIKQARTLINEKDKN